MTNKAVITICSSQSHDPEGKIEVTTVGQFTNNEGTYEAVYEETEISGMEGTTTTVRIDVDTVTLIREGTTSTTMEFKKNNSSVVLYNTPYGMMEFKVTTKQLQIEVDENGGDIFIDYSLGVAGQETLHTKLSLSVKVNN